MKITTYCTAKKDDHYFHLLNFARITKELDKDQNREKDNKAVLEALNSFPESIDPAIRPILPLIYRSTAQTGLRDRLPPHVVKILRDYTLRLITVEMANRQWLIKNLVTFQKENIPVILLKGAAFAGSLYPDSAPRLGLDLDLLVSKDAFGPACALLSKTMNPVLLSSTRVATHDALFERVFTPKEDTRPIVELHRDLTNPSIFHIDQQSLWEASRKHPAYQSDLVRILSPEDTLLHLAVHAFRDLDFCTHNLLDAHEVWCQWQPDEEKLVERAKAWGARKVLFYLLANCQAIMDTPVPDSLLNRLKPGSVSNWMNKKILQSTMADKAAETSFAFRLVQLASQITFPDRMRSGLKFQFFYARTRLNDLIRSLKNNESIGVGKKP